MTSPAAHRRSRSAGLYPAPRARKNFALEHGRGNGASLELLDDRQERVEPFPRRENALPLRLESRQRRGENGLDLAPQLRERPALQRPEHLRVGPFPRAAAGEKLAFDDAAGLRETFESRTHRAARKV